ncbi:MAG: hypothetical protein C4326_10880 [Ignavibacteria bacterium]
MHLARVPLLPIIIALIAVSCSSSKQEKAQTEGSEGSVSSKHTPEVIPPNACRIVATIVEVDSSLKGTSEKDPCSKAPCNATVRIDSVLGYGSAFPKPIGEGSVLRVRFALTLAATDKLSPDIKPALPGLRRGERFKADLTAMPTMGSSEPSYTIQTYHVQQ